MMPFARYDLNGEVMDRFLTDSCGLFEAQELITRQAVWFMGNVIGWDASDNAARVVAKHLAGVGKENFATV